MSKLTGIRENIDELLEIEESGFIQVSREEHEYLLQKQKEKVSKHMQKKSMHQEIKPITLTPEQLEDVLNVVRLEKMTSKNALNNVKNISFLSSKPRKNGWWSKYEA